MIFCYNIIMKFIYKLRKILYTPLFPGTLFFQKKKKLDWSWIKVARFLFIIIVLSASLIIINDELVYRFDTGLWSEDILNADYKGTSVCNVAGLELRGDLHSYYDDDEALIISSEDLIYSLRELEADDSVQAVLLEVDSYGGYPVAAEEAYRAITEFKKPIIVMVRNAATSAAYWAISGADYIIASPVSDIGAIGVTFSYLDRAQQNKQAGLTYNSLSTGKYKDYGDPDKELTSAERELIMRDLQIIHDTFVKSVAESRQLDLQVIQNLADGSSLPGILALETGLVDALGGINEAEDYLAEVLGEKAEVCWE